MKNANKKIIGLGIIAAMRTTFAPAVLSHYLSKNPNRRVKGSHLKFIQSPVTSVITKLLGAQEIVMDKLPSTPSRVGFPQILGRVASGAFAGSVISIANKDSIWKGILLGGISALTASYGCYYVRMYIDEQPGVKDAYVGAVEDVIALASGVALMRD